MGASDGVGGQAALTQLAYVNHLILCGVSSHLLSTSGVLAVALPLRMAQHVSVSQCLLLGGCFCPRCPSASHDFNAADARSDNKVLTSSSEAHSHFHPSLSCCQVFLSLAVTYLGIFLPRLKILVNFVADFSGSSICSFVFQPCSYGDNGQSHHVNLLASFFGRHGF